MRRAWHSSVLAAVPVLWLGFQSPVAARAQVTDAAAVQTEQRRFATPEDAAAAVKAELDADDSAALLDIFGHEYGEVVLGTDPVSARVARRRAGMLARERLTPRRVDSRHVILEFGTQAWPLPIPLVREGGSWIFDTEAGAAEIQARRIGQNELAAMDTLRAIVQAQYGYALRHGDDGSRHFARYIQSTPGEFDGLWWPDGNGGTAGPSPLAGFAAENREFIDARQPGDPFKGYFFRILTGQGRHAPGGARSYLEDGRLERGFAVIAWPADYSATGVMTFLVDRTGRILQQDLGPDTAALANTIRIYDPERSWQVVER
ncbi:hypothetical protein GGE65_007774 [Skermanella aerolata]|uniref:DUF2950 family protein n=1 Tax=Skermanella aerolata TaxID=393310 RepID=UPI003D1C821E